MDLSNVRIREHFGLVSNDTNTGQFSFLVSPPKNRGSVEKQDYVLLDHPLFGEACQILSVIKEITSYEEVTGSTIGDKMGKMLATVDIVGYVDLRREIKPLRKVLVPPNPGSRVYVPLTKFLEDIFNRNALGNPFTQPLHLGLLEASSAEVTDNISNIKCFIDANNLTSNHTLIAATAGAGKTHLSKVLIQELLAKTSVPTIVFDDYAEYINLNVTGQVNVLKAKPDKTENKRTQPKTLPEKTEKETLAKEIKTKQATVLNTQGLTSEEKQTFYKNTLKTLLNLRTEETIPPTLLIVENAENLKGEALDQIVNEGRKTGITLCLISTHPTELGGKILSQIGNQIIGKTTDKTDVEYLQNITNSVNGALPSLAVGEWIINSINASRPMKAQIRELKPT
jgi:DNA helicase HerA-like ATPase